MCHCHDRLKREMEQVLDSGLRIKHTIPATTMRRVKREYASKKHNLTTLLADFVKDAAEDTTQPDQK